MVTEKKEDGKVKVGKESVVETQAEAKTEAETVENEAKNKLPEKEGKQTDETKSEESNEKEKEKDDENSESKDSKSSESEESEEKEKESNEKEKKDELTEEQKSELAEKIKAVDAAGENGYYKKALKLAKELPDFDNADAKETIKKLQVTIQDAWNEAKKAENAGPIRKKKAENAGPVTLASVEKDLFSLSSKVDMLTKARAKAGKPSRQLFILKKRLDTLILMYTKFNKGSKE